MQSGLSWDTWGWSRAGTRIRAELGGQAKVVATGGMAHILAQMTDAIEVVDPMLTLEGLRLIYHLNRQE